MTEDKRKRKRGRKGVSYFKRQTVFARDHCTCVVCGTRGGKLTVDHLIPRKEGGTNDIWNLATMCGHCNSKKGRKLIERFIELSESLRLKYREETT